MLYDQNRGFHIRDTLVLPERLNILPQENVIEILQIKEEFNKLGYIDFRYEMGNDQIRRMSKNQALKLEKIRNKVWELESRVRELLKTPEEVEAQQKQQVEKEAQEKLTRLKYRKRDIESYCQRYLQSKRENATKQEYQDIIKQIEILEGG